MKVMKKCMALVLMMVLAIGLCSNIDAEAAATPGKPKVTVSTLKDGNGVSVAIAKTKNADGYEIVCKGTGDSYNDDDEVSYDYTLKLKVAKDGTEKRTQKIEPLQPGTYEIKVRAYKSEGKSVKYGKYSKAVKVTKESESGSKKSKYDFSKVKKGDIIKFGAYEQDNNTKNGKEEIEWVVLSKSKTQMMVMSKYVLDCQQYNLENIGTTWEKCYLRKWLNEDFYKAAFGEEEQKLIKTTKVKSENGSNGTPGGNDTKDNVFILSFSEATNSDYGFNSDNNVGDLNRRTSATAYAEAQGTDVNLMYKTYEDKAACSWWLRTVGTGASFALFVSNYGSSNYDLNVDSSHIGVRPVIVINLEE